VSPDRRWKVGAARRFDVEPRRDVGRHVVRYVVFGTCIRVGCVQERKWAMTGWTRRRQAQADEKPAADPGLFSVVDLGFGLADWTVRAGVGLGHRVTQVATSVLRPLVHAPAVSLPPEWLVELAHRGHDRRATTRDRLFETFDDMLDVVIPLVASRILDHLDLTTVVRQRVDLDAVVSGIDLDAAAERLDLDGLAARLDAAAVVESLDLNTIASRLDVDGIAARLDVDTLLDRFDLNRIVRERVDVDDIVGLVDLDAVIARIDLVDLTRDIIDAIDLPELIRESTGSMASESVHGIRMRSVAGDEIVGKAMDRLLLRRDGRTAIAADGDGAPEPRDPPP
jgi:hypothetical protein